MGTDKILKFSRDTINRVVSDLNLPDIKITMSHKLKSIGIRKLGNDYKMYINEIFINEIMENEAFDYIKSKFDLNTIKKRFLFALLHEVGHLIQEYRHTNWTARRYISPILMGYLADEEYRNTRLEQNADKIALILFKKYCPLLLTNT